MSQKLLGGGQTDPVLCRLVVSQRRPWLAAFCAYLTVFMIGVPLYLMPKNPGPEAVFNAVALAVFMGIFVSPVTVLGLYFLFRKVEIERTQSHLTVIRRFGFFRRRRRYLLADIRNVQAYGPSRDPAYSTKFELLFEYHGEMVPVVRRLTLAKVNHLIEQLMK